MERGSDSVPLVHAATRFMPPGLRREFVLRSALVDRVLSPDIRLVVVSGPAGSGKSTLLAQAYAACPDAVWLSVEPADDDPAVLWSALVDSTASTVPGFGDRYRRRLDAGGAQAIDSVLPLFINELADTSRPIRFFIDDLHLLSGERSTASLHRLLQQLPPENCLVIASRAAAPFPLGRLRLQRAVVEIDQGDLAMDVDEAQAALAAVGIEVDEDQVVALINRTEGWVAGLAWATMAMQDSPDTTSFVGAIDAIDGELTSYLVEEVLDRQSPELRAFMLEASILRRFNASLCDGLRRRDDSRGLLDELERTNSFLVPLDRRGEWYRFHHLVHDVFAARLQRESPSIVPTLHRRASSWLLEHDMIVESIRHARAAGDDLVAADILCQNWWEMMNGGRIETAYSLFEEFGHTQICEYQPLAIAAAVLYSLAGHHRQAQVFFRAAESGDFEGPPPDGSVSIESSLAIMRGAVAFDGAEAMLAAGERVHELEPITSKWRPLALRMVALGHIWRGELDLAEPILDEAVEFGQSNEALVVYALAERALIRLARDDVDGAVSEAESACAHAEDTGLDTVFVTALAHGATAIAKVAIGDIHAADEHLDAARGPMAAVNTAMPLDAMRTRTVLADAAIRLGRVAEARRYIDEATTTSHQYADTGVLIEQLITVRDRLDRAGRRPPVELSERERSVLELMPSELSIRGIAEALYVSRDTIRTYRRRIYQKLGVSSRAEAVVAARQLGLLPETG